MFLSTGSPGSIRRSIPSNPAISRAANARYGLQEGSGGLNSTRLLLGLVEYIGILTAALRFRFEYTKFTGASYPGINRLYELVVGAHSALVADETTLRTLVETCSCSLLLTR